VRPPVDAASLEQLPSLASAIRCAAMDRRNQELYEELRGIAQACLQEHEREDGRSVVARRTLKRSIDALALYLLYTLLPERALTSMQRVVLEDAWNTFTKEKFDSTATWKMTCASALATLNVRLGRDDEEEELEKPEDHGASSEGAEDFARFESASYDGRILSGNQRPIEVRVGRGQHLRLVGASGSGKTSLMLRLAGLVEDRNLTVNGQHACARKNARTLRRVAYYAAPRTLVDGWSAARHLTFCASPGSWAMAGEVLARAGFEPTSGKTCDSAEALLALLGLDPECCVGNLSMGQRKKLAIAVMLAQVNSQLLLADELLANLDQESAEAMTRVILEYARVSGARNGACTVVFAEHEDRTNLTERLGASCARL
jgi:ABC-type Mn2+/Zn2+ transport system ATPase subunit